MPVSRSLSEWQREFGEAARRKFRNTKKWDQQDRVLSILRQLADVGGAIQKEQSIFPSRDHGHERPNHRIAALIADILILCDERRLDLYAELEEVLEWFRCQRVFVFGSNMSSGRFRAYGVSPTRPGVATVLSDHQLTFNKKSTDGSGKATVVPRASSEVWGVLYTVHAEDLKRLDKGEIGYRRKLLKIRLPNDGNIDAWVYVA